MTSARPPANRISEFPAFATVSPALSPGQETHVSELLGGDGTAIVVSVHDLIDDVGAVRRASELASPHGARLVVLASRSGPQGEYFRNSVLFAKQVGHAPEVHVPSRDLAVLLGVEDARHGEKLRNGILVVTDGRVTWARVAPANRPSDPHRNDLLHQELERRGASADDPSAP